MKRVLMFALLILTVGIGAPSAKSPDDFSHYYRQVRGEKGRKYIRHFLLRQNLVGDKKDIFETYGYTPHRLRIDFAGRITERWVYYSDGLEFVFDEDGNMISEREIAREEGHIE
jgi:hypothetical protein